MADTQKPTMRVAASTPCMSLRNIGRVSNELTIAKRVVKGFINRVDVWSSLFPFNMLLLAALVVIDRVDYTTEIGSIIE